MKIPQTDSMDMIYAIAEKIELRPHRVNDLIVSAIEKSPEVLEVIEFWRQDNFVHFGYTGGSPNIGVRNIEGSDPIEKEIFFSINRDFEKHEAMINWCAEHGIKIPKKGSKYSYLNSDDEPMTTISYEVKMDDKVFYFSYKRAGLSGNKCRIEEVPRKQIICDLD